jgi:hypothetical protein
MISVHHNLEAARRLDSLTVHGLPDRIHIGGAGLDNGLRPHPEANKGGFHRVICDLCSLKSAHIFTNTLFSGELTVWK